MSNLWMSMWLSAWHRAATTARGQGAAHASQQYQAIVNDGTKEMLRFWSGAYLPKPTAAKRLTRRRAKR